MNKTQREKAERLLLKQMLDTSPKLKEVIDGLIDNPNPELKDVIAPVIQAQIEDARKVGIQIGFQACLIGCAKKIETCKSVEEAVEKLMVEANGLRAKMGLDKFENEVIEDENNNV